MAFSRRCALVLIHCSHSLRCSAHVFTFTFLEAIAGSLLDDGNASTAVATAAGGWAGGLAGTCFAILEFLSSMKF